MLVDYVKTTYICSTQQLNDNSLPLIPTPPLIMAVNIGEAECRPLPSDPPWVTESLHSSVVPGYSEEWRGHWPFCRTHGPEQLFCERFFKEWMPNLHFICLGLFSLQFMLKGRY